MRVLRPVDGNAVSLGAALEHFKVVREVGESMLLDLRCQLPQPLPFRHAPCGLVALASQHPEQLVKVLLVSLIAEKSDRVLCLVDSTHWATPFKTCARWRTFTFAPRRCAQPCRCIRHDISEETR